MLWTGGGNNDNNDEKIVSRDRVIINPGLDAAERSVQLSDIHSSIFNYDEFIKFLKTNQEN